MSDSESSVKKKLLQRKLGGLNLPGIACSTAFGDSQSNPDVDDDNFRRPSDEASSPSDLLGLWFRAGTGSVIRLGWLFGTDCVVL